MGSHSSNPSGKKSAGGIRSLKERQKSSYGARSARRTYRSNKGKNTGDQPLPVKAVWIILVFLLIAAIMVIVFTM